MAIVQLMCPCNIKTETGFVNCSSEKLKTVPECVPDTATTLLLSHNHLKSLSDSPFDRFRGLIYLDLGFNNLQYLGNDSFVGLSKLQTLILRSNPLYLNGSYAKDVFQPLKRLEELHIEGTCDTYQHPHYNYIDDQLSRVPTLKRLYLDGLFRRNLGPGFAAIDNLEEMHMDGSTGYCMMDILNNNTFANLRTSSLQKLSLEFCDINFVSQNTFAALRNLTVLNLHHNRRLCAFGLKNLTTGLNTTAVKVLDVSEICKYYPFNISPDHLKGFMGTVIESLDLTNNKINKIDPDLIFALPKTLRYWSLRDNFITDAHFLLNSDLLVNIEKFDLSFQLQWEVHIGRGDLNSTLVHTGTVSSYNMEDVVKEYDVKKEKKYLNQFLKILSLPNFSGRRLLNVTGGVLLNEIEAGINSSPIKLPFKLTMLNMSYINFGYDVIPLDFDPNNTLQILDISNDLLKSWFGPWKGLNNLQVLNLSNNRLTRVSPSSFAYMPNLHELLLDRNKIGRTLMQHNDADKMFLNLKLLEILDLRDNDIRQLPKDIFAEQRHLKHLSLANNSLINLDFHVDSLVSLETFDLSGNQIQALQKQFMRELDQISKYTNYRLLLERNSLLCDCDNIDFVAWLTSTKVYILNKHNITCQYQNKTLISLMRISEIHHKLKAECMALIVVIACVVGFVFLIVIVSLIAVVYYKRWNLNYLFYMGRHNLNPYHPIEGRKIKLVYDAYISYERDQTMRNNDTLHDFVAQYIYTSLTNKGLKVLIREELDSGKMQSDIITQALRKCRKVIALISKDYCSEMWNVYEFNMAAMEGIYTKRQILVPVVIGSITKEDLSSDVYAFLQPQIVPQYLLTSPKHILIDYLAEAVRP